MAAFPPTPEAPQDRLEQEVNDVLVENALLAERYVDSYMDQDLDAMLAVMDENVVTYPLPLFGFGPYRGHAGVREWWAAMESSGAQYEVVVRDVRHIGADRVAVLGEMHSRTGALLGPWAVLLRIRNGLIIESHSYLSNEDTLNELGLLGDSSD
jgi:ketosteroid isomerase-like protein